MPLDTLWEIYTVENKIKFASIAQIVSNVIVFIIIIIGVLIVEDPIIKVFIVAGTRSVMVAVRAITFLIGTVAKITHINVFQFYKPLLRVLIASSVLISLSYILKSFVDIDSWLYLIITVAATGALGIITTGYIILNKAQRQYLHGAVKSKILHK